MANLIRNFTVRRNLLIVAAVLMGLVAGVGARYRTYTANAMREQQVRDFVAAFNARDIDKMLDSVDDKIQWLNIDGAKITIETDGKASLRASMTSYFQSCPSCHSTLEWVQSAGSRVTAMERASWTGKNGPLSQASLSVYEFGDKGIVRVYYFPAERDKAASK